MHPRMHDPEQLWAHPLHVPLQVPIHVAVQASILHPIASAALATIGLPAIARNATIGNTPFAAFLKNSRLDCNSSF